MDFLGQNEAEAWLADNSGPLLAEPSQIEEAVLRVARPIFLVRDEQRLKATDKGRFFLGKRPPENNGFSPVEAYAPRLPPSRLGNKLFKETHGLKYAYVAGAMANGITSVRMVEAVGKAGMIGFFGAAGLSLEQVEEAIVELKERLGEKPFGFNLIHSPNDYDLELALARLYVERGVRRVSASAYLNLTLPLIYYRVKGIHTGADGEVRCPNHVIAKVSRVEVARKFMSPPPEKILSRLVEKNMITEREAQLAAHIPVAEDITAEADSGGHTDNQPAISLLPTMLALRDQMISTHGYKRPPCVGLAGGIATPASAAAAFSMGAAYVLTGSVNQSCVEAGTSSTVREMLAQCRQADVTMAPAADMFEMGVKVQVLKRGTMFPFRAAKLFDLYTRFSQIEQIPEKQRQILERDFFKADFRKVWERTMAFFRQRDPKQIDVAERDPKHKMALIFRSYLGQSSNWATVGVPDRRIDYQIWCGPSMGAFNEWVKGSFLEKPENRKTVTVAMNLLYGAALLTRINWLRYQGATLPAGVEKCGPLPLSEISKRIEE